MFRQICLLSFIPLNWLQEKTSQKWFSLNTQTEETETREKRNTNRGRGRYLLYFSIFKMKETERLSLYSSFSKFLSLLLLCYRDDDRSHDHLWDVKHWTLLTSLLSSWSVTSSLLLIWIPSLSTPRKESRFLLWHTTLFSVVQSQQKERLECEWILKKHWLYDRDINWKERPAQLLGSLLFVERILESSGFPGEAPLEK
jgi:hypothetical protein